MSLLLTLAFVLGFGVGATVDRFIDSPARAANYNQDTTAAPAISFAPDVLLRFWSQQAQSRGVTTDAQWNTAMQTLFASGTSPGMDPTALAFLRSFFIQVVHVGVP